MAFGPIYKRSSKRSEANGEIIAVGWIPGACRGRVFSRATRPATPSSARRASESRRDRRRRPAARFQSRSMGRTADNMSDHPGRPSSLRASESQRESARALTAHEQFSGTHFAARRQSPRLRSLPSGSMPRMLSADLSDALSSSSTIQWCGSGWPPTRATPTGAPGFTASVPGRSCISPHAVRATSKPACLKSRRAPYAVKRLTSSENRVRLGRAGYSGKCSAAGPKNAMNLACHLIGVVDVSWIGVERAQLRREISL